jgi:hypothetical protein
MTVVTGRPPRHEQRWTSVRGWALVERRPSPTSIDAEEA